MSGESLARAQALPVFEMLEPRLLLQSGPPTPLLVDLQAGSDSGIYDDDDLTNVAASIIDITAAREGDTINLYREGALLGQATLVSGVLYRYTFAAGELAETGNVITVRSFDGAEESDDSPPLVITLDVTGPWVATNTPDAPVNLRTTTLDSISVVFSEAIDFDPGGGGSFTIDDVAVSTPDGPIAPAHIAFLGSNEYEITFAAQTRRGTYVVSTGPEISDLAGNLMDQDQDGQSGEPEEDVHAFSFSAYDADTIFASPLTVPPGDTTYDGQDICINGTTVTINGSHFFNSVHLIEGGVLTHTAGSTAGLNLDVAEEIIVSAASAISADGLGYGAADGPGAGESVGRNSAGGGGHGGLGGANTTPWGEVYGDLTEPLLLGSGGGNSYREAGGAGGGMIRLTVGGDLHVDGRISACIARGSWGARMC